jgi:hypothetical protein
VPPPLELLLDGVPDAVARERDRAWSARRRGLFVLGGAAAAEIALLFVRARRSQRRLVAHLEQAAGADAPHALDAAKTSAGVWVFVFAALVAFAFAVVAALATFR